MKKIILGLVLVFSVFFTGAAICPAQAAEKTINILFDDGVGAGLNARQAKSQSQLGEWMEADLVRVFGRHAKNGYQAKLIDKKQDFKAKPDNYLLSVKITEYRAGSKAARMVVGYGAGGVTLKIHYELFANGSSAILSKDDSTYSGREWINAARKLNENTAKAVVEKLGN